MKIDFNKNFKNYLGKETSNVIYEKVAEALYSVGAIPELKMGKEEKFRAYMICQRLISNNGVVDITTEDATMIKDVCAAYLTAGAYGQIQEIIDNQ